MKITKARLKQIVKEETEKILTEAPDGLTDAEARDWERKHAVGAAATDRTYRKMSVKKRADVEAKRREVQDRIDDKAIADRARGERLKKSMAGGRGDSGTGTGVQSLYDEPGGPATFKGRSLAPGGGVDIEASLQQGAAEAEGVANAGGPVERRAYGMLDPSSLRDPEPGDETGANIPDYMRAADSPRSIIARYRKDVEESGYRDATADEEAAIKKLVPYGTPGGTEKIIALMNPEEPAAADEPGASEIKPSARVASGGKLTGRKLNRMRDSGEIDQATWLKARRALANRGQEAARLALGPAIGSTGTTDLATGRSRGRGDQAGYEDAIDQAAADAAAPQVADAAAAAPEQPGLEHVPGMTDPGEADPFNSLSLLKQARAEVLRGAAPSNIKFKRSLNKTYKKRVKVLQRQGASLTDAKYAAADWSLTLLSKKLGVRIARVEAFPETQRMQAKRSRGAAKSRLAAKQFGGGGRDLASLKDQPRSGQPTQTATPWRPPMRESRLLAIIKEELQNVLNEASKYRAVATTPMGKKLAAAGLVAVGYQGLDRAGQAVLDAQKRRPDLADKILAVAMRQAGEGIPSNDLVTALKGIKARPQVAKKAPEKKTTTKTTTVSGTPPPHTMKYGEEGGYVIATATTKDGVVGKGKAKIQGAGGKHSARTAASMRAKVALMKAARTAGGSAPAPPQR